MTQSPVIAVIAKAPEPGRSKTRLCPPCDPQEAADLAEAALADTIDVVMAIPAIRPVLALDGPRGQWLPGGLEVIAQRGTGLDERLASVFDDVGGPAFLIGMDTPQVTSQLLTEAVERLLDPGVDAVLGPAADGGWWGLGLRVPDPRVFRGVPMSTSGTLAAQRARLRGLHLRVRGLPTLRDVDRFEDALAVARLMPPTRFTKTLASIRRVAPGVEVQA